jgi:hypothetical protein
LQHAFQPTLSLCTCHFEVALRAARSTPWPAVLPRRWCIPIGPYKNTLNEAHTKSRCHALTFNVPHFFSRRLAALAMSQMAGRVSKQHNRSSTNDAGWHTCTKIRRDPNTSRNALVNHTGGQNVFEVLGFRHELMGNCVMDGCRSGSAQLFHGFLSLPNLALQLI